MDGMAHASSSSVSFSLGALVLLLGAGCAYSLAAARQRQQGKRWNSWRSLSFWLGIGVLMVAVWPTTMEYAHRDFCGHMLQHLLIGMLAPLGLVLARPISLLLRSVPKTTGRSISRFLHSTPLQLVSSPWVAMVLNVGAMYVLYLTPLYVASLHYGVFHYWLHVHFLAAGYLFTWAILAGPDPGIRRYPLRTRLGVLWLSIASHALLAKLMYGFGWPRGSPHSLEEIQVAAQWMYYWGDAAERLLVIALFARWYTQQRTRRVAFSMVR